MLSLVKSRTLKKDRINYKLNSSRKLYSVMPKKAVKPNKCSRCGDRHLPPTGAKCVRVLPEGNRSETSKVVNDGEVAGPSHDAQTGGSMLYSNPFPESPSVLSSLEI
jgi:hypothetical protein